VNKFPNFFNVIPAQAGNQNATDNWFPACAGMTEIAARIEIGKLFRTRSERGTKVTRDEY